MAIVDIRLQHFRSYHDGSFEFAPGVNIIVGPNASGKTNLLEAVLVIALGSSYRARDRELVEFDEEWARLDAHTDQHLRTVKLVPQSSGTYQKNFVIDDKPIARFTLSHTIPAVLFEPNHLLLLSGPPELRRDFLDGLLEQSVTGFAHLRKQYRRALSQRNALLKQGVRSGANLFAWNIRLSELGGRLALQRQELVTSMNEHISELYRQLSHTESHVELAYKSSCAAESYSSSLLHKLEAGQALDLARGFTGHGPHRDDLVISLNGHPAEETASRGETRTLLLALKILELQQLERLRETKPLLLLDDVFSELDGARRKALTEALAGYQTFITTTDADVVIQHFMDNCNIIALEP